MNREIHLERIAFARLRRLVIKPVSLSARFDITTVEEGILRELLSRYPSPVTSKILHTAVMGVSSGTGGAAQVLVSRLRSKLGAAGIQILTLRKRGYVLASASAERLFNIVEDVAI
jgi:DNA-binding response OmpR family regulator